MNGYSKETLFMVINGDIKLNFSDNKNTNIVISKNASIKDLFENIYHDVGKHDEKTNWKYTLGPWKLVDIIDKHPKYELVLR